MAHVRGGGRRADVPPGHCDAQLRLFRVLTEVKKFGAGAPQPINCEQKIDSRDWVKEKFALT